MIEKVEQFMKERELLRTGDRVLIALSGGADSVSLLHVFGNLRQKLGIELCALYLNHGLRPAAAKREEQFCADLSASLNVPIQVERCNVRKLAAEWKVGEEEAGRRVRYEVLERAADNFGCTKIATGHHADDQAETVLFRVLRGTGVSGLVGIPAKRGRVIRPLLSCTRSEILEYLDEQGVDYCEDRSNLSDRYSRNFIRNRLLPQIRDRVNLNVDEALRNLALNAADAEALVEQAVSRIVEEVVDRTAGGKLRLALEQLRSYDDATGRAVLRHCLTLLSPGQSAPDRETVLQLEGLVRRRSRAVSLAHRCQARVVGNEMIIFRETVPEFASRLEIDGSVRLDLPTLVVTCSRPRRWRGKAARERQSSRVTIDAGRVKGDLTVRSIRRGDRFRPLGLHGSKKVSNYLTDRKVPPVLRDEIPVVSDDNGIVWLVGFEIAERVKVDAKTTEVIDLEVNRQERASAAVV